MMNKIMMMNEISWSNYEEATNNEKSSKLRVDIIPLSLLYTSEISDIMLCKKIEWSLFDQYDLC